MRRASLNQPRATRSDAARARCVAALAICSAVAPATRLLAATQYFAGDGSALTASKYAATAAGPFTSTFTSGSVLGFGTVNGSGVGGTMTIGGIVADESFTLTAASGAINSNGVVGITVAAGKVLDLNAQTFGTAATSGFTFNGNGTGVLEWGGAGTAFGGGFTLNAGIVILRDGNALGNAATNTLTINGGTIGAVASRDLSGKFGGGIVVNGDFTLGSTAGSSLAPGSLAANITFSNAISLGNASRAITIDGTGLYTFSGAIGGSSGSGVTFTSSTGLSTVILGGVNTYTGPSVFNFGKVTLNGSTNSGSALTLNGSTLAPGSSVGTQGFAGLTYANAAVIDGSQMNASAVLNLGTLTRGTGGTLRLQTDQAITTTANRAGSILDGSIIISAGNGTDYEWAVSTSNGITTGNLTRLAAYTTNYGAATASSNFNATTSGTFAATGANSLKFSTAAANTVTLTGAFTIGSGGILVNPAVSANATTITGGTSLTSGASELIVHQMNTNAQGALSINTPIAGSIGLTKAGGGTLALGAANTHSGATVVSAGTLRLANALALQNSTLTTLAQAGAVQFDSSVTANAFTVGGLSGGAALSLTNTAATPAPITLNVGGNNVNTSYAGAIGGSGAINKLGSGVLTLGGTNTFSGGLSIRGGAVAAKAIESLGSSNGTTTIYNAAALRLTTGSTIMSGATRSYVLNGGVDTIDVPNVAGSVVIAGGVSGTGLLNKIGDGSLALTNSNTYSGGTLVAGGTLFANNATSNTSATGSGPVEIASGGQLGGSGEIHGGTVTLDPGASITAGGVAGTIGSLRTDGQVWKPGATYHAKLDNGGGAMGGGWDVIKMASLDLSSLSHSSPFIIALKNDSSGSATIDVTGHRAWTIATYSGPLTLPANTAIAELFVLNTAGFLYTDSSGNDATGRGTFTLAFGSGTIAIDYNAAPEPTTVLLFGGSALGLFGLRRSRVTRTSA